MNNKIISIIIKSAFIILLLSINSTALTSSITNLKDSFWGPNWIYWNWTNPSESEFSQNMIILNGINIANTSNNYYNATSLTSGTKYVMTIHTLNSSGSINTTNVNSTAIATDWTAPIGIPQPPFGIHESHYMYEGKLYNYNGTIAIYQDAGNGPYTHFVNNSSPNCTDTTNVYGNLTRPRCTIPTGSSLTPGSVVEIHGGPYNTGSSIYTLTNRSGNSTHPIFIRGIPEENLIIDRGIRIRSAYLIFENIHSYLNDSARGSYDIRPDSADPISSVHHIAIRNTVTTGIGTTGVSSNGNYVEYNTYFNNTVYCNSTVYPAESEERDDHGIGVAGYTNKIWILDNEVSYCGGDAIGNGHNADYTARNYYIGRNRLHDTSENAIDLKEVENFTISQNTMYNFYGASAGSNGNAFVVHYGPTFSPRNAWVIFNEVFNCSDSGIQVGGSVTDPVYIIGNIIHDIGFGNGTATALLSWGSQKIYVIGNTIYNSDKMIDFTASGSDSQAFIINNIFYNITNLSLYHITLTPSSYISKADIWNNIFYQSTGQVRINWNGAIYNVTNFTSITGKCSGCLQTDPLFVNISAKNITLAIASPAISNGIYSGNASYVYELFYSLYGINISVDFNNINRPQGSGWDIGAYEYIPNQSVSLDSPSNSFITSNSSIQFNCSASDATMLSNITLYGNWTGTWQANQTINISGISNSSNFTKTIPEGTHSWNCLSCNNVSNCVFASNNYTITTDTTTPIVTLVFPSNNSLKTVDSLNFTYNVSDTNSISNCSFILNNGNNQTNSSITKNTNQTFIKTLADGNYNWSVQCKDNTNNQGNSSVFNLTIDFLPLFELNSTEWNFSATTNISNYTKAQLRNITRVNFSNSYGKIEFLENLSLMQSKNITDLIKVIQNKIWINSSLIPEFNKSAQLTFRGISFTLPILKRDSSSCSSAICTNSTFNSSTQIFIINVTSFSIYELVEQCTSGVQDGDETGTDCGGSCSACSSGSAGSSSSGGGGGGSAPITVSVINETNEITHDNKAINYSSPNDLTSSEDDNQNNGQQTENIGIISSIGDFLLKSKGVIEKLLDYYVFIIIAIVIIIVFLVMKKVIHKYPKAKHSGVYVMPRELKKEDFKSTLDRIEKET